MSDDKLGAKIVKDGEGNRYLMVAFPLGSAGSTTQNDRKKAGEYTQSKKNPKIYLHGDGIRETTIEGVSVAARVLGNKKWFPAKDRKASQPSESESTGPDVDSMTEVEGEDLDEVPF